AGLELNGVHFAPADLSRTDGKDELRMSSSNAEAAALKPNPKLLAHVTLKDGRGLDLETAVGPPRPRVTLLSKSVLPGPTPTVIRLGNSDDLPQDGQISFFLRTENPATFPHGEKIEVAMDDGSASVFLNLVDGTLVLEDSQTVLGTLRPVKTFGPSAFGVLRFRPVSEAGETGDWQTLAKLVRIPSLKDVLCPDAPDKPCSLVGQNLFLIDSVASDSQFAHNIAVPVGFADSTLSVPRPNGTLLYIKLRDDPSVVNRAALPVLPQS
ncbi:MAG: hypothetical protein WA623_20450, partial [Candidatus Sulfotelmatobacter sp.]